MQIFYPEVCASSFGSINELVVKENFPSTESIHIFKKPISLTIGMYINIGMKKRETERIVTESVGFVGQKCL